MKNEIEFIKKQFRNHLNYVNSFTKIPSTSNEHINSKTGKTITYLEMEYLIDKDATRRTKTIIKKLNQ